MTGSAGDDLLAVELGDDAQRAVGGRVLRAHVEGHALGLELDVDPGVGGLGGDVGELLALGDGGHRRRLRFGVGLAVALGVVVARPAWARRRRCRATASRAGQQREVLAQRVALELARQVEVARGRGGRRR